MAKCYFHCGLKEKPGEIGIAVKSAESHGAKGFNSGRHVMGVMELSELTVKRLQAPEPGVTWINHAQPGEGQTRLGLGPCLNLEQSEF